MKKFEKNISDPKLICLEKLKKKKENPFLLNIQSNFGNNKKIFN